MPLKDSAAGRHTCWRFFYAAGFRPGGGHVRKSGRRCPALRPPGPRTAPCPAPTWIPTALRPPGPRTAPTWIPTALRPAPSTTPAKTRRGHANTRRPARKPCAVSGFTRYSGPMPCVQSSAAAFVHADLHTSFYKTVAFICATARRCACRPVWFSLGMSQFWSPHRAGLLFTSMALINNFKK